MKKGIAFFTTKGHSLNLRSSLSKNTSSQKLKIPQNTIDRILNHLHSFEENKEYLDTQLSINGLAQTIGTNPNYLSRIINHYKKTSFPQYINSLRIDSCITILQQEPLYLKFTIRAIANKFGFNTPESFGKAFRLKTGVKPSLFIKNLQTISYYKSAS